MKKEKKWDKCDISGWKKILKEYSEKNWTTDVELPKKKMWNTVHLI